MVVSTRVTHLQLASCFSSSAFKLRFRPSEMEHGRSSASLVRWKCLRCLYSAECVHTPSMPREWRIRLFESAAMRLFFAFTELALLCKLTMKPRSTASLDCMKCLGCLYSAECVHLLCRGSDGYGSLNKQQCAVLRILRVAFLYALSMKAFRDGSAMQPQCLLEVPGYGRPLPSRGVQAKFVHRSGLLAPIGSPVLYRGA